jgi:ssRNA-specific RNase YbeY (16S rRNA maturation enzyme)
LINSHNYHEEQARNHELNTRFVEDCLLCSTQHIQALNKELRKSKQEWTDVCEELEVAEELLQEAREELRLLKEDHKDDAIAQRAQHQRLRIARDQAEAQVDEFHAQIQDIISNGVGHITGYEDHTIYAYVNTYQPFAPDNDR